jgi:hypothetical protein
LQSLKPAKLVEARGVADKALPLGHHFQVGDMFRPATAAQEFSVTILECRLHLRLGVKQIVDRGRARPEKPALPDERQDPLWGMGHI